MTQSGHEGAIPPLTESLRAVSAEVAAAVGSPGLDVLADYLRIPVIMQDGHVTDRKAAKLGEALGKYGFTEAQITQLIECGVPSLQPRPHEVGNQTLTAYEVWLSAADTDRTAAPLRVRAGDIIGQTYHTVQGFTPRQLLTLAIQADELAGYRNSSQLPPRYR